MNNKLIIIMWVSWAGKATMLEYLKDFPSIELVRSYSTRDMRPGEVDGDIYHFITPEEFESALDAGEFFEYTYQRGEAYYGTKYKDVEDAFATGKTPLKEIDMEWVLKMKAAKTLDGRYITMFLDIPNDVMIERITRREPMPQEKIQRRIDKANEERKTLDICDYVIDADRPVEEVKQSVLDILWL